jgi:transposase-like protein
MKEQSRTGQGKKPRKKFSMAFKLMIVDQVEKGEYSYKQIQEKYGLTGHVTVLNWLRKFGSLNWSKTEFVNKRSTPQKQIRELQRKIRQLENEKIILNRVIDLADETMGAEIRKKYLPLLSEASKKQQGKTQ